MGGLLYLEGRQLIGAVIALNAANGISFIDLLGITTILPTIAHDFQAEGTISWAATSQLVGATIGQCILGYMSDLYSRRRMLQFATLLLAVSALACGVCRYAKSAPLLYVIRAFSGIATGSISNLVNIAQNDFLPVHRRGKYQGIQGISVGVGSIIGIVAGAGFATNVGRWDILYYMETGLALLAFVLTCIFVPANISPPKWSAVKSTLEKFDILGILTGTAFVVPLLILISQGSSFGVDSPVTIVLIVLTILGSGAFLYFGWKDRGIRPVLPFVLFRNPTITAILLQNILFGAVYYTVTYFIPLYWQVTRSMTPLRGAVLFIPYFVTHGFWSTVSGNIVSILQNRGGKSYSYVLTFGFGIWTIAMALLAWESAKRESKTGIIIAMEVLVGFGTGSVFQNSIMAIRAQVTAEHNAVAVSARNVLRFFGGALGIAISSSVLELRLKYSMPWRLEYVSDTAFSRSPTAGLSPSDQAIVQHAYGLAISTIFYVSTGMLGICFLLCGMVKDVRLPPKNFQSQAETSGVQTPNNGLQTPNHLLSRGGSVANESPKSKGSTTAGRELEDLEMQATRSTFEP